MRGLSCASCTHGTCAVALLLPATATLAHPCASSMYVSLQSCVTNEVTHVIKTYPTIKPAGLLLNVDVMLPVYEPADESEFMEDETEGNEDD